MNRLLFAISLFLILAMAPLQAGKVDVNKADAQALQENLEGVGEVKAKAIVNYRRKHGKFKSLDDLMQVPGIGEATINKNRRNLSLKGGASKSAKSATNKTKSAGNKTDKASSKKKTSASKSKTSQSKNSTKTTKKTAKKTEGKSKKESKK